MICLVMIGNDALCVLTLDILALVLALALALRLGLV
jgi:hypothetical protein